MDMNIAIIITMNIYISKANENWLRLQRTSMSGIINNFLDEARAGKHGPHVLASYPTKADALKSDKINPWQTTAKNPATTAANSASPIKPKATPLEPSGPATTLIKTCKIHGTLLDSRGRCGQKGCKFA